MSEFYLMAATLLYIKSRMLLPLELDLDDEIEDPRRELVEIGRERRFQQCALARRVHRERILSVDEALPPHAASVSDAAAATATSFHFLDMLVVSLVGLAAPGVAPNERKLVGRCRCLFHRSVSTM